MNEIKNRVSKIIESLCGTPMERTDQSLKEDLAFDSLRMVMLLVSLEDEFSIVLDESDMNPFLLQNVEDVCLLVKKYIDCLEESENE